jgi:hypothetical protein
MYYDIHTRMKDKPDKKPTTPHKVFLQEIAGLWPLAKGSLTEVRKPCTRKSCKTCAEGLGHLAFIFTYREGGKLRCMHVRPGQVAEIHLAIENGRKLEAKLTCLGREAVLRHRKKDT